MLPESTPGQSVALRIARGLASLLALLLLLGALYYYFVPAQVPSEQGVFGCGSAANPPADGFARGACQGTATINLYRALALLAGALLLPLLAYLLFRESGGRSDWDDDVDLDERPRRDGGELRGGSRHGSSRGAAQGGGSWAAGEDDDDLDGIPARESRSSRRVDVRGRRSGRTGGEDSRVVLDDGDRRESSRSRGSLFGDEEH